MNHWIDLFAHMILYSWLAALAFMALIVALGYASDWLRARSRDPIFRCEVQEWEQELGRKLTRGERASLAKYNHG